MTGLVILLALVTSHQREPQRTAPLRLVQTIAMPDVNGRIDHFAVDVKGQRLFVAALGNNTVEVIDLKAGKRAHTIRGLREPQGLAYAPAADRIYVANGQGEGVDVFSGKDYAKIGTVALGDDTDNLRIDPATGDIIAGYGSGALAFIMPNDKGGKVLHRIPLQGHPESFQIDPKGKTIYVNVPSLKVIEICSTNEPKPIKWITFSDAEANYPMALDAARGMLLVGCRKPAMLLIFDADGGTIKAGKPVVEDVDDMFLDSSHDRLYVIGGGGAVDVFEYQSGFRFGRIARIDTAPGARTGLFVPAFHRLYVAVPHRGGQQCEIRVFEAQP